MTAAATTGPNREPRPTSSTPAIRRAPDCHAIFSNFNVQRRRLSRRSLAAAGESVFSGASLSLEDTEQRRYFVKCEMDDRSIFADVGPVQQAEKRVSGNGSTSCVAQRN